MVRATLRARSTLVVLALLAGGLALHLTTSSGAAPLGGTVASTPALPPGGPVLGMTVSCPTWGWEWGSDAMVETLHELHELGVNWVAIHPYAGIGNDGSVSFRGLDGPEAPVWLSRPIAEAHALGMKILIKPHIAYWGSQWSWRGEIALPDPTARARFFADYERWMARLAVASRGADAFAVGTELDKTIQHEAEWRRIIATVRAGYEGPLTYAANWTDYQRVPFWDALDAIGVQAYFPLVPGAGDDGGVPSEAQLDAGWSRVMKDLRATSERVGRPVVFTELGYNRSSKAAAEPWKYDVGGPRAEEVQARCLSAAIRAMDAEPSVVGAFLWKWFPGSAQPHDFSASAPHMRAIIQSEWGGR
jgi:hypothetical protein